MASCIHDIETSVSIKREECLTSLKPINFCRKRVTFSLLSYTEDIKGHPKNAAKVYISCLNCNVLRMTGSGKGQ